MKNNGRKIIAAVVAIIAAYLLVRLVQHERYYYLDLAYGGCTGKVCNTNTDVNGYRRDILNSQCRGYEKSVGVACAKGPAPPAKPCPEVCLVNEGPDPYYETTMYKLPVGQVAYSDSPYYRVALERDECNC